MLEDLVLVIAILLGGGFASTRASTPYLGNASNEKLIH
jgi:hypothetical protein